MSSCNEKILLAQQRKAIRVLNRDGFAAYDQLLQTSDILDFLNEEEKEYFVSLKFQDLSGPDEDDDKDVDCRSIEADGVDCVDARPRFEAHSGRYETRMQFSPGIRDEIIKMIRNCSDSIKIAVFMFMDECIFKEVCNKKTSNPKIDVFILVDKTQFAQFKKMAQKIIMKSFINKKMGIKVSAITRNGKTPGKAHEKFMIVDESHALTGSYNFTWTSEHANYEQVVISNDPKAIVTPLLWQFDNLSEDIQYSTL